ncbi:hypothetical protein [Halorubrum ezzemoulense]|uniref:hypothetical protein n=1 Tax=Halorubrum ezzemoulense TaxID=337243 RepID=UPI00232B947C|nr:hypothetical protein [Halorubrum ezzemoulense]MDB9253989.1 hypothetical protein [Halorubrum ezzemoulense]MDB9257465.1 hypothetical protein [Halorubrum ezzemoulense]MDB9278112.1 hypothetical protein [Halorubrum ezzemoulense]
MEVELTQADSSVWTEVLGLQFDREQNEVFGGFDPEHVEGAVEDASVTISSETHDTLTTEFGQGYYRIQGEYPRLQARDESDNSDTPCYR